MEYKARVDFTIIQSNEEVFSQGPDGGKLTKTDYRMNYSGSLDGTSEFTELKNYTANGTITSVGLERITCRLGEKSGSFVLEHKGSVKDGIITSYRQILYGSGTDELAGIRGEVKIESNEPKAFFILNYSLD